MKQQPDKLFQEKLAGYSRPAPSAAWDKIESNLAKKNSNVIWMRVAAAIIFLVISVPVIYTLTRETPNEITKSNPAPAKQETAGEQRLPTTTNESHSAKKSEATPPSAPQVSVEDNHARTMEHVAVNESPVDEDPSSVAEEFQDGTPAEIISEVTEVAPVPSDQTLAFKETPEQGVTLVISAEETTAYIETDKNLLTPDATAKKKNTSTFKRLLRKASDLKTNQDPFGELRQMKNEILALNFKSDKKRSQKTN